MPDVGLLSRWAARSGFGGVWHANLRLTGLFGAGARGHFPSLACRRMAERRRSFVLQPPDSTGRGALAWTVRSVAAETANTPSRVARRGDLGRDALTQGIC